MSERRSPEISLLVRVVVNVGQLSDQVCIPWNVNCIDSTSSAQESEDDGNGEPEHEVEDYYVIKGDDSGVGRVLKRL